METNLSMKINPYQRLHKIMRIQQDIGEEEYQVKYCPLKSPDTTKNKDIIINNIYIEKEINPFLKLKESNLYLEKSDSSNIKKIEENIFREVKIIKQLKHKNIHRLIDYFQTKDEYIHLIFENYATDLFNIIKNQQSKNSYFSESVILDYFTQVCSGVKYIHDRKLIHRNINPSNILLISNKIIKIGNFDFSRVLYSKKEKSATFAIKNTFDEYLSPEILLKLPYSFKNDIWSLGILLFHLMTLRYPFTKEQMKDICDTKKIEPLSIRVNIPNFYSNELIKLCIDLLNPIPAERPDINSIINNYYIIKNKLTGHSNKENSSSQLEASKYSFGVNYNCSECKKNIIVIKNGKENNLAKKLEMENKLKEKNNKNKNNESLGNSSLPSTIRGIVIDKEENLTKLLSKESLVNSEKDKTSSSSHNNSIKKRGISINLIKKNDFIKVINIDGKKKKK